MAKHDVNLGINKTLGGAAFIASTIAVGTSDAMFNMFGNPIVTGLIGGVAGWGIAQSQPGAGGGVVAMAALLFAFSLYMGLG